MKYARTIFKIETVNVAIALIQFANHQPSFVTLFCSSDTMNKLKLNFLHKIVLFGTLFVMIAGQEYRQGQYPSKTRLFGVTYNPFQLDSFEICLPIKTVESDMKIIKDVADHIRM